MTNQDSFEPPTHVATPVSANEANLPVARPVTVPVVTPDGLERSLFRLERSSAKSAWIDTGILILCLVTLEVVISSAAFLGTGIGRVTASVQSNLPASQIADFQGEVTRTLLVPMVLLRAAVACAIIWMMVTLRKQGRVSVGLGCRNWLLDVGIGILALPVVYGVIYMVMLPLVMFVPALREQAGENISRITSVVPKLPLIGFFLFACVVGLYEELIFRGFLLTRLRRGTNSWTAAVILSSILFIVPHAMDQTMVMLVPVGILSLSFTALTIWRRSIIPGIVTHLLFDFSQFVLIYFIIKA